MTIYIKELKQSFRSLCIWTASIAFMMLVCILLFPEMKSKMDSVSDLFANMGGFTAAFGMDKLSFGEIMGFYGIECGNVLSIGGGFFAALAGISVLANEEKERTAEFLLTHPVSRLSVVSQKLLSVLTQVVVLNLVVVGVSLISAAVVGEEFEMKEFILLHIAYLLMQLEISCICFGISAFIRRGSIGIGLGLALALYFLNIVCNISEQAEFLRYITPYAYADASSIISEDKLDIGLIAVGAVIAVIGAAVGFFRYLKKDISA
ncbi:MAG: ABC transporter permease subunit [Oscillospiraceae bacterium]|nr:ABC transporter permease subunit [Oscillospiraceae bacterium]